MSMDNFDMLRAITEILIGDLKEAGKQFMGQWQDGRDMGAFCRRLLCQGYGVTYDQAITMCAEELDALLLKKTKEWLEREEE